LILGVGVLLAGCGGETDVSLTTTLLPPPPTGTPEIISLPDLEKPVTIKFGESLQINTEGDGLSFIEVVEDSRCASDVTCVWEGRVTVGLLIERGGQAPKNVLLSLGGLSEGHVTELLIENIWVRLVDVSPYPISTESTQVEDYTVILEIEAYDK